MNRNRHAARGTLSLAAMLLAAAVLAEDNRSGEDPANTGDCGAAALLDWTSETDTGETKPRSRRCGGSYLDPLEGEDTSRDPVDQEIVATAARSELQGDIVRLFGKVEAQQGYRRLRASEAEFNQLTHVVELLGDVELREPGLLLRGATGTFDNNSGEARLTAGQLVLHDEHIRAGADLMRRRSDGNIEFDDGFYSYCPPTRDSWMMHAEDVELKLDEGYGVARDAVIELGGVPVLYTPYLEFPITDERRSGFLWGDIGDDSRGGLDVATPYYFNLAPNYDATLTPRYINERGLLTELELRYLAHSVGFWELAGAWIGGDDEYQRDRPEEDGDRWLTAVEQKGLFHGRWRTRIDYTKTSDDDYFRDIDTTSLDVRQGTELLQLGRVDYLGDNWLATLKAEDFQSISQDVVREPYATLPSLRIVRTAAPESFTPNLLWESEYADFDHPDLVTGKRLYNAIGATYPMEWIWGFVTPTAKYRQINYDLDSEVLFQSELDDAPDVGAPMLSLDAGLFFERQTGWGLQTLEPRVYYLWSDFEDQTGLPDFDTAALTFSYDQLFRDTRFSGYDRIDDSKQLSVGLTTRLIDPDTGREKLVASIGQIYFLEDREVEVRPSDPLANESSSPVAAQLALRLADNWDFRSEWLWNTQENELDQTALQFSWQGEDEAVFNLGYSFRRSRSPFINRGLDTNQVDMSSYIPVSRDWRLFFRSLYDFENKERVNDLVGIEYNSCCWRVRLGYQRFINQRTNQFDPELVEYDNAIYFQFHLKGLGGVGSTLTDVLEDNIRGYRDSEL
jgi:LPS-assembly protein